MDEGTECLTCGRFVSMDKETGWLDDFCSNVCANEYDNHKYNQEREKEAEDDYDDYQQSLPLD